MIYIMRLAQLVELTLGQIGGTLELYVKSIFNARMWHPQM